MIFAIADLHFDYSKEKPMGIFGLNWTDHEEKIIQDWQEKVDDNDLVLLPGDISWGLKLNDGLKDLERIDNLPGKKIISKGNHDYWWGSISKMNSLNFKSINYLHNNSYEYGNYSICGTRGWASRDSNEFSKKDEVIYLRELNRLKNSLELRKKEKTIVMIHYPPYNQDFTPNEFTEILRDYKVELCVYGHLHGPGHRYVFNGEMLGVKIKCVASDYIDFKLEKIIDGN